MRRKYPLEALSRLRQSRTEERARELGAARVSTRAAEGEAERVALARRSEQAAVSLESASERERLEAGEATAQDLQQAELFLLGATGRLSRLALEQEGAERAALEARKVEASAEAELVRARADERVVERHRERFEAAERRVGEDAEDEASLERWTADRYGKTRA